jgi:hypothetical protein
MRYLNQNASEMPMDSPKKVRTSFHAVHSAAKPAAVLGIAKTINKKGPRFSLSP